MADSSNAVARPKLTSKSKIERPLLPKVFQYILWGLRNNFCVTDGEFQPAYGI